MDTSVRYFGLTVDTMPTPMNSIARTHAAVSQCRTRCNGVKVARFMARRQSPFEDSPPPRPCADRKTWRKQRSGPPGTDRPMF